MELTNIITQFNEKKDIYCVNGILPCGEGMIGVPGPGGPLPGGPFKSKFILFKNQFANDSNKKK